MKTAWVGSLVIGYVGALIGASAVVAVPQAARVGYVTVPQVLAGTTEGQALHKVEEARRQALKPTVQALQKLQPKMRSGNATFEEREQYKKLTDQYTLINRKFNAQFDQLMKPFDKRLQVAIATSARTQGYSLVVDGVIALESGLLLYSDKSVADLTPLVMKAFKKK
jgi:Skp family chaperone for outer membrane proteins